MTRHEGPPGTAAPSDRSAPTGFTYWREISGPKGEHVMRATRERIGADPHLPPDVIAGLGRDRMRGDALSDQFIAAAKERKFIRHARAMVGQALVGGVASVTDAPPELTALFEQIESTPEWVDLARVERGAAYFRRFGVEAWHYYGIASIDGYRKEEIFRPLVLTGAYTGGSAYSRFLETCQFWRDISEPEALRPGGAGVATAVMVRIMHSMVRTTVAPHPEWDGERLGLPLNQMDQFATTLAAFVLHGVAPLLGRRSTPEQVLDYMHFWRYVNHFLGIEPAFWPETVADWWRMAGAMALCTPTPGGPDAATLGTSFMNAYLPGPTDTGAARVRRRVTYRRQIGLSSRYLSRHARALCELPPPGIWRHLAILVQLPDRIDDLVRRVVPATEPLLDRRSRRRRDRWLSREMAHGPAKFQVVETLSR